VEGSPESLGAASLFWMFVLPAYYWPKSKVGGPRRCRAHFNWGKDRVGQRFQPNWNASVFSTIGSTMTVARKANDGLARVSSYRF